MEESLGKVEYVIKFFWFRRISEPFQLDIHGRQLKSKFLKSTPDFGSEGSIKCLGRLLELSEPVIMSFQVTSDQGAALRATLLNDSGKTPLHERFRALFMLKAVGGDEVVKIISQGLSDPSPLLKHELAYVLGQMSNPLAISTLESVLIDQNHQHTSMVRHEAAEALGALSSEGSLPLLRRYLKDPSREVRETCEVAIGKIEFDTTEEGKSRKTK